MKAYTILLAVVLLLAACGRSATPTADVAATATTAPAAVIVATTAPLTTTTETMATGEITTGAVTTATVPGQTADWLNTASVEGDYYILGNPAAPVRLTDYSDFL